MNTIKQIADENGKGIHSMFNACMHKAECCSKDDEIADLKRQLEESTNLAKRCSDWGEERRQSALDACERAMQRKDENEVLRKQLDESQARESRLREALEYKHDAVQSLMEWCIKNINKWSFPQYDHLDYANAKMEKALALPHDDTALREYRDAVIEECAKACGDKGAIKYAGLTIGEQCAIAVRNLKSPTYEALEREHLGDPEKQTGIYSPKKSAS